MIAVIGCGLIGSAAARHLASSGQSVSLVGPKEGASDTNWPASHYDEGRITRRNATDPFWATVSAASIERYAKIAEASGIPFFTEVGAMMAGPRDSNFFRKTLETRSHFPETSEHLAQDRLAESFPFFAFGPTIEAAFEPREAGYISPRNLVAAQSKIAQDKGAVLVPEPALSIHETKDQVTIKTPNADLTADQVIVAAGGLTDHLLPIKPGLKVYARTVAFFEVSEAEALRLSKMPSLVYRDEAGRDPYLLPPIRYPNGKFYVKLGGDPVDKPLENAADIHAWYKTQGSSDVRDYLEASIRRLMPSLEILGVHSAACMTTFSPSGYPIITRLTPRLTVATAGNGAGAKCSDELGRLAVSALMGTKDILLSKTGLDT